MKTEIEFKDLPKGDTFTAEVFENRLFFIKINTLDDSIYLNACCISQSKSGKLFYFLDDHKVYPVSGEIQIVETTKTTMPKYAL